MSVRHLVLSGGSRPCISDFLMVHPPGSRMMWPALPVLDYRVLGVGWRYGWPLVPHWTGSGALLAPCDPDPSAPDPFLAASPLACSPWALSSIPTPSFLWVGLTPGCPALSCTTGTPPSSVLPSPWLPPSERATTPLTCCLPPSSSPRDSGPSAGWPPLVGGGRGA